jgi:hypothetical protein
MAPSPTMHAIMPAILPKDAIVPRSRSLSMTGPIFALVVRGSVPARGRARALIDRAPSVT